MERIDIVARPQIREGRKLVRRSGSDASGAKMPLHASVSIYAQEVILSLQPTPKFERRPSTEISGRDISLSRSLGTPTGDVARRFAFS